MYDKKKSTETCYRGSMKPQNCDTATNVHFYEYIIIWQYHWK